MTEGNFASLCGWVSPTVYSDGLRCSRICKSVLQHFWCSEGTLQERNILSVRNSVTEDYIEASFRFGDIILFDQLNVIDTGQDHNRGKGGKKHEKKSIIGQCLMVGNNRCCPQNNE